MQASTRIGIALCVLVAGAVFAGLFRKAPEEVASPADPSEGSLALRQPDQAPFLAANAPVGGWRNKAADITVATNEQRQPAALAAANGAPAAPPMPLPVVPEAAGSGAASSSAVLSGPLSPRIVGRATAPPTRAATVAVDDDWQLHEVVDGDTLRALAERYLGDPSLAEAIRSANPALMQNADILPIGAFLKIPSRGSVRSTTAERPGGSPSGSGWRKARDGRP